MAHPEDGRRAALVYGNQLHLLATYRSLYQFAWAAMETRLALRDLLSTDLSGIALDYGEVHALRTAWRFLPAFDHPRSPGCCLVSRSGESGWEYRGSGESLTAHGEALPVLDHAAVRAPELASVYVIGGDGIARRVGLASGIGDAGIGSARFSALGPELVLEPDLARLNGSARLMRAGCEAWSGTAQWDGMAGALEAVEGEHFRRAGHRTPGDAHVHFFGAKLGGRCASVENGDEIAVQWEALGSQLRVVIQKERTSPEPIVLTL
ncbi:MAG TPA: hypothetical protein VIY49_24465 [Bryobacteraceae bacterium]